MTATTALTAQDTTGVHAIHHVPSAFVRQQIDLCLADIGAYDSVETVWLRGKQAARGNLAVGGE